MRLSMPALPAAGERKRALRQAVLAQRDRLSPEARRAASEWITRKALAMPEYGRAKGVMSYCSFASEVDTATFNAAVLASGRMLVLPKVDRASGKLAIYRIGDLASDLVAGTWGIREPDPQRCTPARCDNVDYVFVPGAVFDRRGGRIGYGKGYYDRLFAELETAGRRPFRVAGCFSVQLAESVPMEPFDVRMHALITESGSFRADHPMIS